MTAWRDAGLIVAENKRFTVYAWPTGSNKGRGSWHSAGADSRRQAY